MNAETKTINGREITYKDVIHHDVTTHFDFIDRIRILFHGKLVTNSEIYTAEESNVLASTGMVHVRPIFVKKRKAYFTMEAPNEKNCNVGS